MKTAIRGKPMPLTDAENQRLQELYDTQGLDFEGYMRWLKDDDERLRLLRKRVRYLRTLSGACPEGTVYSPELNECVEV